MKVAGGQLDIGWDGRKEHDANYGDEVLKSCNKLNRPTAYNTLHF